MATKKKHTIVKSNALVQASYRLTLAEMRLILYAITIARDSQEEITADTFITIRATEYAEAFDLPKNQAYEQLKDAALTLYRRELFLYDQDPETNKDQVIPTRWVSAVPYIKDAGIVKIQFTTQIIPYITRLQVEFTRYDLEHIANMSSPHAVRIYELLKQWGRIGKRSIEVEWLKSALQIDIEYTRWDNMKIRVIDTAVEQINKHSDLNCAYSTSKTGRKITHLDFTFSPKVAEKPAEATKTTTSSQDITKTKPKPPIAPTRATNKDPTIGTKEMKSIRELMGIMEENMPKQTPPPKFQRYRNRQQRQSRGLKKSKQNERH